MHRLAAALLATTIGGCEAADEPAADTAVALLPHAQLPPPMYIVDSNNNNNDTSRYYVSVNTSRGWVSSTNVSGFWGTGYFAAPSLWDYDPVEFWFRLDADACLKVDAWWTAAFDRAPNTPIQSYKNGGNDLIAVVYRNQATNGGRWNEIGRYVFTAGWNRVLVSRWADLGKYVIADAVQVTPVDDCPGWCGPDNDGDGVRQCQDACDDDPSKTSPGTCGCGVPETDTDGDGAKDCQETCDTDPDKTSPGVCGCGTPDTDSDGDGARDCQESCDTDPNKTSPGTCGCGVADRDTDGDGVLDCLETCPTDTAKTSPGTCGCGVPDVDSDGDGALDCLDDCASDPGKVAPGVCGCGVADTDADTDGFADCTDACPADPAKALEIGACGCGVADADFDGDGAADCVDGCPEDADKIEPGACGCGTLDEDVTGDGIADCVTCGNGLAEAPETCDDGARDPGDGCDATCQWEELLFSLSPGQMDVENSLSVFQAQPGQRVHFLVSGRLGSTQLPGCPPGTVAPVANPAVLGAPFADAGGVATLAAVPPESARGGTFGFVAVELASCRVSDVWLESF